MSFIKVFLVHCYLLEIINNLKGLTEKNPDNCLHTKLTLHLDQIRWPLGDASNGNLTAFSNAETHEMFFQEI